VDGDVVTGRVGGVSVAGWFKLQGSQTGSFISPGFSGAAVFDETWRRIFGIGPSAESQLTPSGRADYDRINAEECRLHASRAKHAEVKQRRSWSPMTLWSGRAGYAA
jgi:hypothetical protein